MLCSNRRKSLSCSLGVHDSSELSRKFAMHVPLQDALLLFLQSSSIAQRYTGDIQRSSIPPKSTPINQIVVTWSLPQPSLPSIAFSYIPCLISCDFRTMKDEQAWCYRCRSIGHITSYCFGTEQCSYCSDYQDSKA